MHSQPLPVVTADIIIVGGGAAGLATAIFARRRLPKRHIVLLDGAPKLGAKIRVSGGGRCNVTNRVVTADDFCGGNPRIIRRILAALTVPQALGFFSDLGLELHEEAHGKLFPRSNNSGEVLDLLLGGVRHSRVDLRTAQRVTAVSVHANGLRVQTPTTTFSAPAVVLATGGKSLPKTGSDGGGYRLAVDLGHTVVPPVPALVPLVLDGQFHQDLSGITQEVTLELRGSRPTPVRRSGALLWTHFGISGPAVLDISRHWTRARQEGRPLSLSVDFIVEDRHAAEQHLLALVGSNPRMQLHNALARWLPNRVARRCLQHLGIDAAQTLAQLSRELRRQLLHTLQTWPLPVVRDRGYNYAEVTAGGVPLPEIDPATMGSRACPGLYLVGEILDVDGRIGGFNFQWSWSSAFQSARGLERQFQTTS